MSRNIKYTQEQKIEACINCLSGAKSTIQVARELGMPKYGDRTIRTWIQMYLIYGEAAFIHSNKNKKYTKEFKETIAKERVNNSSVGNIAVKYNISTYLVRKWTNMYNSNIELKDYDPHPEVYMATRKKTTNEERIEIVNYCLEHNKDYKGTALKFECSYGQVYKWVKNYLDKGAEGLADNRGHRKAEKDLSELEKAQRRIAKLEREKQELIREYTLLKKVEELERMWSIDFLNQK